MRKTAIIVASMVLALSITPLVGCGGTSSNQGSKAQDQQEQPAKTSAELLDERIAAKPELQAAVQSMDAVMASNPSFEAVTEAFYAIEPASIQSDVFAKSIKDKQVTWSGYVIDPAAHAIIVDEAHWYGQPWDSAAPEAAYAFSTRDCDLSGYAPGDYITVTGTVGARGANLDGATYNWRLENVQIVE